jgi:hypothetical protein
VRVDPQTPHTRDELYVIAAGTGDFTCGNETRTKPVWKFPAISKLDGATVWFGGAMFCRTGD